MFSLNFRVPGPSLRVLYHQKLKAPDAILATLINDGVLNGIEEGDTKLLAYINPVQLCCKVLRCLHLKRHIHIQASQSSLGFLGIQIIPWETLLSDKFKTWDISSVPYRISNKSILTEALPFAHATLGVRPKCQLKCVLLSPELWFSPEKKKQSHTSHVYCNHRHCYHLRLRPTLTRTHPVWLCSTWHGRFRSFITSDDKL